MSEEKRSYLQVAAYDIASGTVGGIAQVLAGHPLVRNFFWI